MPAKYVSYGVGGQLSLSADSCDELIKYQEIFSQLNRKLTKNEEFFCSVELQTEGEKCFAKFDHCLPKKLQNLQGLKSRHKGPNCWNFALYALGVVPAKRKALPEEMTFFANSDYCEERRDGKPQPGDLGLFRMKDGAEVHAFIYIDEKVAFSKNGEEPNTPYAVVTWEEMIKSYRSPRECKPSKEFPEKCITEVSYISCSRGNEFVRSRSLATLEIFSKLDSFETSLQQLNFSEEFKITLKDRKNRTNKIENLARLLVNLRNQVVEIQNLAQKVSMFDNDRVEINVRLRSLRNQVWLHEEVYRNYREVKEIKILVNQLKNAIEDRLN